MKAIPVRKISSKEQNNAGRFSIRDIQQILNTGQVIRLG